MLRLIEASWLPLFLAFVIGVLTGWWMWAHYRPQYRRFRGEGGVLAGQPYEPGFPTVRVAEPAPVVTEPAAPPPTLAVAAPVKRVRKPSAKVAPRSKAPKIAQNALAEAIPQIKPRKPRVAKPESRLTAIGIPAANGAADDLLKIKGVGPKLNALLINLGVTRFDQIAAWKSREIALVDGNLGAFRGRILREEWVAQAKLLASGKIRTFEARFGKLDSENV